jgi:hypothetical protein
MEFSEVELKGDERCAETKAMGVDDEAVAMTTTTITGPAVVPVEPTRKS